MTLLALVFLTSVLARALVLALVLDASMWPCSVA